ncbi:hypothetical protein IFM89_021598 [Coptis chinensis]|uniref:Myosin-15 n=1 Tax=Coptis chinensis TaxID=261450 RepID=A0A835IEN4_9MAGN|nr:hypothetical protein IFM89_021598 [Coptis chinensis]
MMREKKMSFRKGYNVWFEDKDSAWLPAQVVDVSGKQIQIVTNYGKKMFVLVEKLYTRDADADHAGVDDMTKLPYLNEPEVLFNLARRYALNDIYTYTGSILIAVNPFTKLPHLYNAHMMEQYKGATFGVLSPHVFAVADASYRAMVNEGRSQSILVSGESGAGKTETTKLLMQYLTYVGGRAASDDRTVEQQVLESNPLLEAFGNARTVRNDNSSRFGKFVEIQFDANGRISGAAIRTYLLERSRVVQITDPERNYHCFYQLCASGKDAEKYKLGHPSNFHYLNQSRTYELDGVSSALEYLKTRRSMDVVGISADDQQSIFRTLAAILHLGNIEFSPGKEHDSSTIKDQNSSFHLQMASTLFMCDANLLLATLCTRSIQTREGMIVKALDCNAAIASRDALAKTVYARLFDWLVEKINRSVGQDMESKAQIGVLDIYGFECFQNNRSFPFAHEEAELKSQVSAVSKRFEQFCINFANEKLQQHFNEHIFKMEQEEYRKEKINWSYIDFIDNQDVLDLIEKKPIGIIALLDEACLFPKSTHATFSTKLFQCLQSHKRLEKTKFSETNFTISHYAGKASIVTYQTDSFLDKNRDYVVVEHSNLLGSSKCSFVAGLFPSLQEESSRSSYKFSSVSSRFKQQLQSLMESLNSTEPHYIRCVKPNSLNRPQKFENQSVLHQLRCGGVLEAVRISLAGYPTRRTYSEFVDRFGILAPELMDGSYDVKALTERLLKKLHLENFQLGRTKLFLRAGQIAILDSRRADVLDSAARLIQNQLRTYIAYRNFTSIRSASVVLQTYCRGCLARNIFAERKEASAALLIQKYVRRWLHRRSYLQLYSAAVLVQSNIRGFSARQKFLLRKEHKAAMLIQARWRMFKVQSTFRHYQSSIVAIQCLWRKKIAKRQLWRLKREANETGALRLAKNKLAQQLEDLTWRLNLEKRLRVSNEEAKLVEISKLHNMLTSLNKELDVAKLATVSECKKNSLLETQLEVSMKEKSALESRLVGIADLSKDNALLKSALESFEKQKSALEHELVKAQKDSSDAMRKLHEVEDNCTQLQQNLQSLEEKLSVLEDENLVLRQKVINTSPRSHLPGLAKPMSEKHSSLLLLSTDEKAVFESPTPTKYIVPFAHSISDSRRPRMTTEKHQDNHEFLLRCIKEDTGFKQGKPVAACIIYKCLLHWRAFESERTAIFDHIIASINDALKAGDQDYVLPYWLSNASTLLCLLQRNLRSNGFLSTPSQRSGGYSGFSGRMTQRTLKLIGFEESVSLVEARYPAILFKQQLTACVEKIFGLIRDNLKKELSPLLGLCIQVPSFFIRKLITQVFSFINISLFNSLLLRRECCNFSNGEYVKSGLAELERWIVNTTEELQFAGTSWHELNYIRQAVGFLVQENTSVKNLSKRLSPFLINYGPCENFQVIHQKRKKSLEEIKQDLCPVVAQMRDFLNKDSKDFNSNSFLLDDDLSIPFSTEDISKAIPATDPSDVDLPPFLRECPSAQFLVAGS